MADAPEAVDLPTINRWFSITRLRAAVAVTLFAVVLEGLGVAEIRLEAVLVVAAVLIATSTIALLIPSVQRAPRTLFYAQNLIDLACITGGVAMATSGLGAILFRPIYALVIVPASLLSVGTGLGMVAAATLGHTLLFAFEGAPFPQVFGTIEFLTPPFLFLLIAQQCFFYAAHLKQKNSTLTALAQRLEDSRQRLASEVRMTGALVEATRTLSASLEEPELQSRLNRTVRQQLRADWTGTFHVDPECGTFRMVASTDPEAAAGDIGRLELPLAGWAAARRLTQEPLVVLTGPAGRMPAQFASGRELGTLILAALHKEKALVGFVAVGWGTLPQAEVDQAVGLLSGIAQHATVVMRNARLLEEVRLASAMKSEFVGAISHELRSPINVMLGYFEMLLDGGLGDLGSDQTDAITRTRRYAVELNEMITALLDLNRLEAGRLPLEKGPVEVGALLEQIARELPENWRRPEVDLKLAIVPGLPTVDTDAGKLKTVVRNLLHNAFKFTAHGRVTLGAGRNAEGAVVITVTDTGRGIPPEALQYIFDMFRQVAGAGGGGVGLGLHLVRRLLDVLGGTIAVESRVGQGTCFTVTLPCAPAVTATARRAQA